MSDLPYLQALFTFFMQSGHTHFRASLQRDLFLCFLWERLCVLRRTIEPASGVRSCSSFVTQVRKQPFKREEGGPPSTNEGGRGFAQTPPPLSTPLLVPGYTETQTHTHAHTHVCLDENEQEGQIILDSHKKAEKSIISFIRKNI